MDSQVKMALILKTGDAVIVNGNCVGIYRGDYDVEMVLMYRPLIGPVLMYFAELENVEGYIIPYPEDLDICHVLRLAWTRSVPFHVALKRYFFRGNWDPGCRFFYEAYRWAFRQCRIAGVANPFADLLTINDIRTTLPCIGKIGR